MFDIRVKIFECGLLINIIVCSTTLRMDCLDITQLCCFGIVILLHQSIYFTVILIDFPTLTIHHSYTLHYNILIKCLLNSFGTIFWMLLQIITKFGWKVRHDTRNSVVECSLEIFFVIQNPEVYLKYEEVVMNK